MTAENTAQSSDLHEETRSIWNQNATFWDDKMRDGNDFQRILVGPSKRGVMLSLQPGENVLEIACGNGVFAHHTAQLGVSIVATDFSAQLLERAQARTSEYTDALNIASSMPHEKIRLLPWPSNALMQWSAIWRSWT